ncbi:MAG TPA: SIMPL domain-containing protein [Candidatus Caccomonas pullistercoris]|nr:SIMPL domain-containing protein [Candidatus Caccomonas pullistercoris]
MKHYLWETLLLSLGLAVLGLFVYLGLNSLGNRERVVAVRGLAEREVKADRVIWPVVYKTTGNDLPALYGQLNDVSAKIRTFLVENGIPATDISTGAPEIVDLRADRYNTNRVADRYNVTLVTTVVTGKVDAARSLMSRMGELLKSGIAISANDYGNQVQYEFNGLNAIKPAMIEEATHNARKAAEQFAKDSESELGKIKSASQGLFTVSDRDSYTPYVKRVRVVTTVNFYLGN